MTGETAASGTGEVRPTGARAQLCSWLLGAFICVELLYLPVANVLKLVPLGKPLPRGELVDDPQFRTSRGSDWLVPLEALGTACDRWGELTGQPQGWSLFAPHYGRMASMPVVVFIWREPPREVRVPSHFAPADAERPGARPPEPRCRLYLYEYRMAVAGWSWDPRPLAEQSETLAKNATEQAARLRRSIQAYLRWSWDRYRRAHPDERVPDVVELRAALYPAPDRETGVRPTGRDLPIAAWEPAAEPPAGHFPLKFFEPGTGRLVWLPAEGGG
jgi:hypothetical protein